MHHYKMITIRALQSNSHYIIQQASFSPTNRAITLNRISVNRIYFRESHLKSFKGQLDIENYNISTSNLIQNYSTISSVHVFTVENLPIRS